MDLTSCLEIRSTPAVASSANTDAGNGSRKCSKEARGNDEEDQESDGDDIDDGLSQRNGFNLVGCVDELIASADLEQLQSNREFLALPRFCVEVLHSSKEDRDAVQPRPLCELVLDWAHRKWLDDSSVDVDENFVQKSTLLIMSKDNSLQDCKEVEEGSPYDSDLIQDYKKSNQHLDKPKNSRKVVGRRTKAATVKPAKPREMLYTRQIHQEDASRSDDAQEYCWKVIAAHRLDNKSIMGVVSLDAKLVILSVVQR